MKVSSQFAVCLEPDRTVIHNETTEMNVIQCTEAAEQRLYITELVPKMWASLIHHPSEAVREFNK